MMTMRILFCWLLLLAATAAASAQSSYLFVGTYTNTGNLNNPGAKLDSTGSKGIYVYRFEGGSDPREAGSDSRAGSDPREAGSAPAGGGKLRGEPRIRLLSHTKGVCNPSYLAMAPDGHHLYACTESRMKGAGSVSSFDFIREEGKLQLINKRSSVGDNPAYVSVSGTGKYVGVANYTDGSMGLYPVSGNGALDTMQLWMKYRGHGVDSARQEAPHVHSVVFSPDDKWCYVQDLGLDRVSVHTFDSGMALKIFGRAMIFETDWVPGKPGETHDITTVPGSGPRHLTFHPNGQYAYLLEEMGGSVDVYRYHPENGRLDSLQRIAAHASDTQGPFRSADIHVSPDGRFLYASNRAESNIAIFSIEPSTGLLTTVGYQPTFGKEPRNFTLDPSGRWLLVANQDSNAIVVFRVDRETGLLERTGKTIEVPAPTCLTMLQ